MEIFYTCSPNSGRKATIQINAVKRNDILFEVNQMLLAKTGIILPVYEALHKIGTYAGIVAPIISGLKDLNKITPIR